MIDFDVSKVPSGLTADRFAFMVLEGAFEKADTKKHTRSAGSEPFGMMRQLELDDPRDVMEDII